ncbi:MAG: hypothetical protein AAFR61_31960 [Bacteroidota bacterium]
MNTHQFSIPRSQVIAGLFSFILIVFLGSLSAQVSFEEQYAIMPPSPTASALGEYGAVPVNFSSGLPQIGIPLTQIKGRQLGLDISLSYHSGGVKIDEIPSWVGLGWSLNAGGVITRSVKGQPDDKPGSGWLHMHNTTTNYLDYLESGACGDPNHADYQDCQTIVDLFNQGLVDAAPDEFYFNVAGISGKFMLDENLEPIVFPAQEIRIEINTGNYVDNHPNVGSLNPSPNSLIQEIILTGPDGTIYTFDKPEFSQEGYVGQTYNQDNYHFSGWYLTQIQSADKREIIRLTYEPFFLDLRGRDLRYYETDTGQDTTIYNRNISYTWHLDSIISTSHYLTFEVSDRTDLIDVFTTGTFSVPNRSGTNDLGFKLDTLRLYTNDGVLVSKYGFDYSDHKDRMYLDEVSEVSNIGTSFSKPPHSFTYFQRNNLPEPIWTQAIGSLLNESNAMDFWGYYNAKSQTEILPTTVAFYHFNADSTVFNPIPRTYLRGDRYPDTTAMKTGTLTRIDYPTGGYTAFTYEAHKFSKVGGLVPLHISPGSILSDLNPAPGDRPLGRQEVDYAFDINPTVIDMGQGGIGSQCIVEVKRDTFLTGENYVHNLSYPATYLPHTILTLEWGFDNQGACSSQSGRVSFLDLNLDTIFTKTYGSINESGSEEYLFPSGSYILESEGIGIDITAKITYRKIQGTGERIGGGLRIKEIRSSTNGTGPDLVKSYDYREAFADQALPGVPTYSQGVIASLPEFLKFESNGQKIFSGPQVRLGGWGNSEIQYPIVTERVIGGGAGRTIYTYNSAWQIPDQIEYGCSILDPAIHPTAYPFENLDMELYHYYSPYASPNDPNVCSYFSSAVTNNSWRRGDLLKVEVYNEAENLVQFTENLYDFHDSSTTFQAIHTVNGKPYSTYTVVSAHKFIGTITQTERDHNQTDLVQITHNYHESPNHFQKTRSRTTNSDGTIVESRSKFPPDYSSIVSFTGGPTINELLSRHMILPPIEVQTWQGETEDSLKITTGGITTFSRSIVGNDTLIKPHKQYLLETEQALTAASLAENQNSGLFTSIFPASSYYAERAELTFDFATGQLTSLKKTQGPSKAYLWNEGANLPIAETVNATEDQIAFSSFEDGSLGGWSYSGTPNTTVFKTGTRAYPLTSGSITKANFPAGTYTFSCWATSEPTLSGATISSLNDQTESDGQGWTYYAYRIEYSGSGTFSVSGSSGNIDEVRLHPEMAHMTTYCYDSRDRIHTATDLNSRPQYFDYDDLNRLTHIWDQDRNLLQRFTYNYKGQ